MGAICITDEGLGKERHIGYQSLELDLESLALCFFMFSKAKWVLPTPGNYRVQSQIWFLIMHLHIRFCIEFLSSSPCLLEKNGKSQSKLAGGEKISMEMPIFLYST